MNDADSLNIFMTLVKQIIGITAIFNSNAVNRLPPTPKSAENQCKDNGKQDTEYDGAWVSKYGFETRPCNGP